MVAAILDSYVIMWSSCDLGMGQLKPGTRDMYIFLLIKQYNAKYSHICV